MTINDPDATTETLVITAGLRLVSNALRRGDVALARAHMDVLKESVGNLDRAIDRVAETLRESMGG